MKEIWKPIENYEGLYEVSNHSRVRSLDWYQTRYSRNGKEYLTLHRGRILKTRLNPSGYPYVNLYKDGVMTSKVLHRLVAIAFIPNPDNLPCINHKDENPANPSISNLEWCTYSYNTRYGTGTKRQVEAFKRSGGNCKKVLCVETGEIFRSCREAADFAGVTPQAVNMALKHKNRCKRAGGYTFVYVDDKEVCNE